jgi:hypothetical protein
MKLTLDNGSTVEVGHLTAREDYLRSWLRENAPHVPTNYGEQFETMSLSDLIDAVDAQLPPGFGYFTFDRDDSNYGIWALDTSLWVYVRGGIPEDIHEPERTRITQGVYKSLYGRFVTTNQRSKTMPSTLTDVLSYGPIVAHDEDYNILVTVNGSYFNIWVEWDESTWNNTDCYATGFENGLYGQDMAKVIERAEEILESLLNLADEEQ